MKHSLITRLLSSLPACSLYPTKHKKAEKKDPQYLHISNHYFEKKGEDGVVSIQRVGITYCKKERK